MKNQVLDGSCLVHGMGPLEWWPVQVQISLWLKCIDHKTVVFRFTSYVSRRVHQNSLRDIFGMETNVTALDVL